MRLQGWTEQYLIYFRLQMLDENCRKLTMVIMMLGVMARNNNKCLQPWYNTSEINLKIQNKKKKTESTLSSWNLKQEGNQVQVHRGNSFNHFLYDMQSSPNIPNPLPSMRLNAWLVKLICLLWWITVRITLHKPVFTIRLVGCGVG